MELLYQLSYVGLYSLLKPNFPNSSTIIFLTSTGAQSESRTHGAHIEQRFYRPLPPPTGLPAQIFKRPEPERGFEPPTFTLQKCCSTTELLRQSYCHIWNTKLEIYLQYLSLFQVNISPTSSFAPIQIPKTRS